MSTCSVPVANTDDRSQWSDLASYRPSESLNSVIIKIQDIDSDAIGDLNNDFYAITVDSVSGE
jgi:hypothetical protein